MSSLSILPIEILECITGITLTSQQLRLWQCGDRILNIKLKNGGLKRTSLCWSGNTWMPWPRWYFTTFDRLEDIEWGVSIGRSLCPTLELNLLPKTLKRLHLACEDVFILLRQQNVNMNEMVPLLESLCLSGSRLREENLKNLPSNLIELSVTSNEEKVESSRLFGDLPRHIERLRFRFKVVDESKLENDLPSQLISLDIHNLKCNFNWFSKLPKSLKMLKIDFHNCPLNWLTLPPQLEELVVKSRWRGLSKSMLPQLPQSLKTIEAFEIVDLTADDKLGPLLPKNLTKFALHSPSPWASLNHSGLQQIPASLTDFDVTVAATHPDLLSFYSHDSTKIRITGGPFSDQLNLFPFPTKLQSLELPSINDDICALLPAGLKELKIFGGLITSKGASKLPKSLTSLTTYFELFDDNQTMSYLRHISKLGLILKGKLTRSNLNENWISFLLCSSRTSSHCGYSSDVTNVNGFNQQLTSLHVFAGYGQANNGPFIKKLFFDALPNLANLNTLDLSGFAGIESDWLCLIPPSVTRLELSFLTAYPTSAQLATLPKCLQYLDFIVKGEECEWTDETLQSLPRSLQLLRIHHPAPNLTQRMCEYLPPNLHEFASQFGTFNHDVIFIAPLDRLYGENEI